MFFKYYNTCAAGLILISALFIVGCVSVEVPPDYEGDINLNMSLYKSNAGAENVLDQKTDAIAEIPLTQQGNVGRED